MATSQQLLSWINCFHKEMVDHRGCWLERLFTAEENLIKAVNSLVTFIQLCDETIFFIIICPFDFSLLLH